MYRKRFDESGQLDDIYWEANATYMEYMGDGVWCIMIDDIGGDKDKEQRIFIRGVTTISDYDGKIYSRAKEKKAKMSE